MISDFINKFLAKPITSSAANECAQLAATALMIEVIKADHNLEHREMNSLRANVASAFDLESGDLDQHIEKAENIANQATSLWEHTDLINKFCDQEEKFNLVVSMWKIALSDGDIHRYEEHLIRRASDLIYVPHPKFIEAKHIAAQTAQT
jgi:uncharacterized tellurite resistance protein B-like protein